MNSFICALPEKQHNSLQLAQNQTCKELVSLRLLGITKLESLSHSCNDACQKNDGELAATHTTSP